MANIIKNAFLMGSKESETVDLVRGRVGESMSAFGGQNKIFRELNRYYLSLSPPVETRDNDQAISVGRREDPDIFVPTSFTIVESAVPQWLFAQFGRRPHVTVMGRTQDDEKGAKAATSMIDYDFERSKVFLSAIPYAKCLFKYGTGIGKVSYRYNSRKTKRMVEKEEATGMDRLMQLLTKKVNKLEDHVLIDFDGPWMDWVSPFNFGVDTLYPEMYDMRYLWERRWTDRLTLERENESYKELNNGKALYKHLDRIPVMPKGFAEGVYELDAADDTSEAMGWTNFPGFRRQGYAQVRDVDSDRDRAVEIVEYWDKWNDRWVQLANGEVPIYDGEIPYWDKDYPYISTKCIDLEGYFWGMGYLRPIKGTQEEQNSVRNLNMRQAKLNTANVFAVDETVDLPEQGIEIDPGDVVQVPFYASGKPALVPLFPQRTLPPEAQIYEDRLMGDVERAVAMSSLRTGGGGSSGIDTATEAKMMGAAEERRIQLVNMVGEHTFMQELARKFLSRRQQYFKKEQAFRILGKEGAEWMEMTPQDIAGDFDYMPEGQQTHMGREVLRQQILQALALTQNPAIAQVSNVYEQVKEFWVNTDFRWADRFTFQPPDKQWDPLQENIVLDAGEFVPVAPNEPHEDHIQAHMQGMGENQSMQGMMRRQEHIGSHQKFVKPQSSAGPSNPQEQPGLRGYAGNVPNPGNQGPESAGGIASRVNAGPGV